MPRLAVLLVVVPLAVACGGTTKEADEPAPPARSASLFLARPAGPTGPLTAYDSQRLSVRFRLPAGLLSADGKTLVALRDGTLQRFAPKTGARLGSSPVPDGWRLAAVSASARWVALVRGRTSVRVLDRAGEIVHELSLRGDFVVETVADDGRFLFLQQNFADGSYAVRGYDLAEGALLPGSLATKGETVLMQGLAAGTVASPDGRWLLTLYVDTKRDAAFVHALNILDRFPLCIDLPPCDECTVAQLRRWALALAPGGRTLFAVNPALGRVAEVHLPTSRVIHQSRFEPDPGGHETRAAVAPDGSQLVFTNGSRLWTYDTHRGFATAAGDVAGVADLRVSPDGSRVLVARRGAQPVALEI